MSSHKITIANDVLLPEIERMLAQGTDVHLRAKGHSMYPYIRDSRDILVLSPVGDRTLAPGDIVLARVGTSAWVVHRIVGIDGDRVTLKGDGNIRATETCRRADVSGYLTGIRRGDCLIDCNTRTQRMLARAMHAAYVAAYHVNALRRRLMNRH